MQFALYNKLRKEAEPGLKGICLHCHDEVIAKCGTKNIWHWAHAKNSECDSWTEPETQWHRDWKTNFGADFSEIRIEKNSIYHIADVLNKNGIVFEFQNSSISAEIIKLREEFYGEKMIWVLNGISFKDNFRIYEEPFIKQWKFNILDEFSALNYTEIKNALIIEDWQIQKDEVRSYLSESGFVHHPLLKVYYLDLNKHKHANREQLIAKLNEEILSLYISLQKLKDSEKAEFTWDSPRRSWEHASRPLFIDFGGNFLFLLHSGYGKKTGKGIKINKAKFLEKYS